MGSAEKNMTRVLQAGYTERCMGECCKQAIPRDAWESVASRLYREMHGGISRTTSYAVYAMLFAPG
jgi:hypothetical protein